MDRNRFHDWIRRRGGGAWAGLFAGLMVCGVVAGEPFQWRAAMPESQGFDGARLEALRVELARRETKGLLIIRNDRIVVEWYAEDHGADRKHYTASLAKSLVGGMSLLVVRQDGLIEVDAAACRYIPDWREDPMKSRITVRQLATHSSGIEDAEEGDLPHAELTGWKGDFWKREPDPFSVALNRAPVMFEPGGRFAYSNPGMAALARCVTTVLQGTPHRDVRTCLRERVFGPIGIEPGEWSIGYGQTYEVEGLPLVANWGGGNFTARAVARVGRLMLREGDWEGGRLIDAGLVRDSIAYGGTPLPDRTEDRAWPAPGLGWYNNSEGVWSTVPRDAFAGAGAGHQLLLVVPSLKLIVMRNGGLLEPAERTPFWTALSEHLFEPLMGALDAGETAGGDTVPAPYPASPAIEEIRWAPAESIVRLAEGSDNWPITWADDDELYTAYGDGWGFEPRVDEKLSLGFARVRGTPPEIRGTNIRAPSGDQRGDGAGGRKASGMLMVEGVLYMWVRNAGNSQLAWSRDRARTWSWSDWRFGEGFAAPVFLNFGRNYAGARDDYVYVYSFDSDSAYEPADRMVLARVPKNRILERAAYEFFVGVDGEGEPRWSSGIEERGAVFRHPGQCYRSGITFHPALKRYLWVQIFPGADLRFQGGEGDPRFEGGFGVFDAPEPWGPWTTAYFTRRWDVGPGETASFPAKWMSEDGTKIHLLFSGDDCFSVRAATLVTRSTR